MPDPAEVLRELRESVAQRSQPQPSPVPEANPSAPLSGVGNAFERNANWILPAAAVGGALFGRQAARGAARIAEAVPPAIRQPASVIPSATQKIFSPAAVKDAPGTGGLPEMPAYHPTSARTGEALLRAEGGRGARETDRAWAELEPHWNEVSKMDDARKRAFINYVETRSTGTQLFDKKYQPVADRIAKVYADAHSRISEMTGDERKAFVRDYYHHNWERTAESEAQLEMMAKQAHASGGRTGTGAFLKQRTIPTIEDGIARGLRPKSLDPIKTTLDYVQNAQRFLSNKQALNQAKTMGLVRYIQIGGGNKAPAGWMPLEGAMAQRGIGQRAYAPEGFARVWNNHVSRGMTGAAGDLRKAAQHTFNTVTQFELGLSAFHAVNMAVESAIADGAAVFGDVAHGRWLQAAKGAATLPYKAVTSPYTRFKRGQDVEASWLGKTPGSEHMQRVVKLMERAGGRAQSFRHAEDYHASALGNYYDAWTHGTLPGELKAMAKDAAARPYTIPVKAFSLVSRFMDTVNKPLFEGYVPRIKNGAFYDAMSQWLERNPEASLGEQTQAARAIWDSVDNRFGEVVQDNIFWNRTLKQSMQLAMRSYSWNLGTVREIGGGIKDIATGDIKSQRAAYVIALPIITGMLNAMYQFLKTGQGPQSETDLIAPQTGGTDPATGKPERRRPVGYINDVFGWYDDPIREATGKLSTGPGTLIELARNRDYMEHQIANPNDPAMKQIAAYFEHVATKMVPFSGRALYQGQKRGSNITPLESVMGLRAAGLNYVAPERLRAIKAKQAQREAAKVKRYEQKQQRYYQGE